MSKTDIDQNKPLAGQRQLRSVSLPKSSSNVTGSDSGRKLKVDEAILTDGTNSPTADIDWDGNKITKLKDGSADSDAATWGQVIKELRKLATGLSYAEPIKEITATPPVVQIEDVYYIVGAGATGDWAGHDADIAWWDESKWNFRTPLPPSAAIKAEAHLNEDDNQIYAYSYDVIKSEGKWNKVGSVSNARGTTVYIGRGLFNQDKMTLADNFGMPLGTFPDPKTKMPASGDAYIDITSNQFIQIDTIAANAIVGITPEYGDERHFEFTVPVGTVDGAALCFLTDMPASTHITTIEVREKGRADGAVYRFTVESSSGSGSILQPRFCDAHNAPFDEFVLQWSAALQQYINVKAKAAASGKTFEVIVKTDDYDLGTLVGVSATRAGDISHSGRNWFRATVNFPLEQHSGTSWNSKTNQLTFHSDDGTSQTIAISEGAAKLQLDDGTGNTIIKSFNYIPFPNGATLKFQMQALQTMQPNILLENTKVSDIVEKSLLYQIGGDNNNYVKDGTLTPSTDGASTFWEISYDASNGTKANTPCLVELTRVDLSDDECVIWVNARWKRAVGTQGMTHATGYIKRNNLKTRPFTVITVTDNQGNQCVYWRCV